MGLHVAPLRRILPLAFRQILRPIARATGGKSTTHRLTAPEQRACPWYELSRMMKAP